MTYSAKIPARRLDAARASVSAYAAARGFSDQIDTDIIDQITDLLHLAAQKTTKDMFTPDMIHRIALMHYEKENNA